MTGSPRILREACSPMYPAIMAQRQMQADSEKAKSEKDDKSGEYKPLDLNADYVVNVNADDKPGKCAWKVVVVPLALFLLIIHAVEEGWFAQILAYLSGKSCAAPQTIHRHGPSWSSTDIRRSWGQYSPYHAAPPSLPPSIPHSCRVTFVQSLARHGSRFPTSSKTAKYSKLFEEFLPHVPNDSFTGKYAFLKDYNYTLGSDDLTITGRIEMADLGLDFYSRYKGLIIDEETASPFIRSAGSARVVESAELFARALQMAWLDDMPPSTDPADLGDFSVLTIPEGSHSNSTLSRGLCRNELLSPNRKVGKHARDAFADHAIRPITDRLNADLQLTGGRKLSIKKTRYLMDMCPFEVSAALHPQNPSDKTSDGAGLSPFCDLFTDSEWRNYAYLATLDKFYGYSHGNPLGPTAGVGFANELIARLTAQPVEDHTSTNRTLDADPKTFPIGHVGHGRSARIFADFSHDNDITSIHAALGLYNSTGYEEALLSTPEWQGFESTGLSKLLPIIRRQDPEDVLGYSAAWTVPFGARTYIEGLACAGVDQMLVRILVNDRVIDLRDHACGGDERWMCKLNDFVTSLGFARSGGKWDKCFD